MEKKCSKCNVDRDVSEFNKAKESKDYILFDGVVIIKFCKLGV